MGEEQCGQVRKRVETARIARFESTINSRWQQRFILCCTMFPLD